MPETAVPVSTSTGAGSAGIAAVTMTIFSLTSTTAILAGQTATVTVSSTAQMSQGQFVLCDDGTPNREWVQIISITSGTQFTASFQFAHGPSSWTISATYQLQAIVVSDPSSPGRFLTIGAVGSDPGGGAPCLTIQGSASAAPVLVVNGVSPGVAGFAPVSGASTNGTVIGTRPSACNGIELHLPNNSTPATITYLVASSAPGGPPASGTTEVLTGPSAGNPLVWPISLGPGQNVYVTALSGLIQFRYV